MSLVRTPVYSFCSNFVPERESDMKLIEKTEKLCNIIRKVEKSNEYDDYELD